MRLIASACLSVCLALSAWGQGQVVGGGGAAPLPSQTGHSGKFLNTDGSKVSWVAVPGGGDMVAANNLSDIPVPATALANLGGQPADADLTALAGLTSAANKLPYFTGSQTAALADFTAYGRSIAAVADEAAFKALVNLEPGTDVQAQDPQLAAVAGLTPAADQVIYWTSSTAASMTGLSSFARTFLDDANAAAVLTTLGSVIGTNTQAFDSDLSCVAALSSVAFIVRTGTGTCALRTLSSTSNEIEITNPTGVGGNPVFGFPASTTFAAKELILPGSNTLPATCTVGAVYIDRDATTGRRFYVCESTNTWVLQGTTGGGDSAGDAGAVQLSGGDGAFSAVAIVTGATPKVLMQSDSNPATFEDLSASMIPAEFDGTLAGIVTPADYTAISGTTAPIYQCQTGTLTGAITGTGGTATPTAALTAGVFVITVDVPSTDTVRICLVNHTGSSNTPGSESFNVRLIDELYR